MIRKVWFKNYRNLKEIVFDLDRSHSVVIFGDNNQGKTNFLEGIFVGSRGETPLYHAMESVVNTEALESVIGLDFLADEEIHRLYVKIDRNGKRRYQHNQKELKTLKSFKKDLLVEFLSADVLRLLQDDPDCRRKEMDSLCCLLFLDYQQCLTQYTKVLKQKNYSLKSKVGLNYRQIWNKQLAEVGEKIVDYRKEALEKVNKQMVEISKNFSTIFSEETKVNYKITRLPEDKKPYNELFYEQLIKDQEKETLLGYTLSGPHRDDFSLSIHGKNLQQYYSRGINRMAAILFKVGQWCELESQFKQFPLLLLDDVFAELDTKNREILIHYLNRKTKIVYATVQKEDYHFFDNVQVFQMINGVLHVVE